MKKLITTITLFIGLSTFGQQHGIKLNLGSFIYPGFLEAQYEYSLSEKTSIQIGAGLGLKEHRLIRALETEAELGLSPGETNPYSDIKTPSFRLTGEVKFFTGEDGPRGFYLAPFLRYYSYGVNSTFKADVNDNSNTQVIRDFKLKAKVNALAIGLGLGSQWLIEDKWAIDIMWFGIGYGTGKISADYTSNSDINWDEARDELQREFEKNEIDFIKKAKITSKSNGLGVSLKNPVPLVIRSTISVGYFF